MPNVDPKIPQSWKDALQEEFSKEYFIQLKQFLLDEEAKFTIYPRNKNIFAAYNSMEFHDVKVVILGQDPCCTKKIKDFKVF